MSQESEKTPVTREEMLFVFKLIEERLMAHAQSIFQLGIMLEYVTDRLSALKTPNGEQLIDFTLGDDFAKYHERKVQETKEAYERVQKEQEANRTAVEGLKSLLAGQQ